MKQQKGETGERQTKVVKTLAEGDYYRGLIFIRELANQIEKLVLRLNTNSKLDMNEIIKSTSTVGQ